MTGNFLEGSHIAVMELTSMNPKTLKLSPKHLFRSKKDRSSLSRSDAPSSFSSGTSSSSSSDGSSSTTLNPANAALVGSSTPTSVLPDWSDNQCDFVEAFRLIDRDNDGFVSREELEAVLTRLGAAQPLSQEEVTMMLSEVDEEGRGCISVEAIMNRVGAACGPVCESDELREAFDVFDTDHDGKISAEELMRVFKAIGEERCTLEECRRMIEGVDRNGDGFVCFDDFSRMMELQSQR
ncbi:putative calcium-binding protein CML36 [Senna tora]|uniref:Putative calcium-binding protein CML36 n=1 Tax=Senna tora TaxID=362788 RepID=A0A834W343_9FABA|nr:putative calcium-binding protein CML36 [Senna tora]